MSGSRRDVSLNILGQIDDYRRSLARLPGITDEAAAKAALKLQNRFARAAHKQLRDQEMAARRSADAWQKMGRAAAAAMGALATVQSLRGLVDMRQRIADLTNEMGDTAAQTGIAVETLNAFRTAANSSGAELSTLIPSIRQFPKRLSDMTRGTGEAKFAFEELGITADDARAMLGDTDAAIRLVIARLKQVPDAGQQAAMATALFGESGVILNQVLGNNTIEDWVAAARGGVDVSDAAVRAGQEWQVVMARLSDEWSGFLQAMLSVGDGADSTLRWLGGKFAAFLTLIEEGSEIAGRRFRQNMRAAVAFVTGDWATAFSAMHSVVTTLDDDFTTLDRAVFEAERQFHRSVSTMVVQAAASREVAAAADTAATSLGDAADAASDLRAAIAEVAAAEDRVRRIVAEATSVHLTAQQRVLRAAADRYQEEIEDLRTSDLIDEETALAAQIAVNQSAQREITRIVAEESARAKEAYEAAAAERARADEAAAAAAVQAARRGRDAIISAAQGGLDQIQAIYEFAATRQGDLARQSQDRIAELQQRRADLDRQLAAQYETEGRWHNTRLERQRDRVDAAIAAEREIAAEHAALQRRALQNAQAAALFQIGVQTAVAIVRALAELGPIAGGIASGLILATGAAQASMVMAEPMPTFFGGTSRVPGGSGAGEQVVRMHSGEAILNAGATANLGREIIDALNAGLEPFAGGAGGGIVVLDGKQVGRVIAQQARRRGPLRTALRGAAPVGYKSPFGRN